MNKLMVISEYRETRFTGEKKPSVATIKRWIAGGILPGKKLGGQYYVDITAEQQVSGNDLVDAVLQRSM